MQNAYDAKGKAPYRRWFADGLGRYVDQKKFPTILHELGLQLPKVERQNKPGTDKILTEKNLAGYRKSLDGTKANRVGVTVLDSSDMLDMLGYGNKPVVLAEGKVIVGQQNHPSITATVWKKVPEWIEDPAAVFESDTVSGRLVFVAPESILGAPVLLIVEPNAGISGSLTAHLLLNSYDTLGGKTPYSRWINDGLLLYMDKKKFPAVLERAGLQLPRKATKNQPGTKKILTEKNLAGYRKSLVGANNSVEDIKQALVGTYGDLLTGLENKGLVEVVQTEQVAFTITDNMRATVADGLPLFSKNNRNVHANIDWVQSQDQSHDALVKAAFGLQGYTQGAYTIIEPQAEPKVSGVYGGSAGLRNQSTMGSTRNTRGSQQATGQKNLYDTLALG